MYDMFMLFSLMQFSQIITTASLHKALWTSPVIYTNSCLIFLVIYYLYVLRNAG